MKLNPLVMMRREFDNTGMVFDPQNNKAMTLNAVGVEIWESIEKGLAEDAIVTHLTGKFNVDKATAAADLSDFLKLLKDKGLLSEK